MLRTLRVWPFVALTCACMAACTLDFGKFESAAASTSASTGGSATASTSSGASSTSTGGAAGGPSCDMQYGTAPSYIPCVESQVCEFNASVDGTSCGEICSGHGGECLYAFQNQADCGHGSRLACDFSDNQTIICVCSRGCGSGPPCQAPETCATGTCG
jgi:hypothetical protein